MKNNGTRNCSWRDLCLCGTCPGMPRVLRGRVTARGWTRTMPRATFEQFMAITYGLTLHGA